MMKVYKKAILPPGFKAGAVSAGIKKSGGLDLALFYSDVPAVTACKFTANKIQAAPVQLNRMYLKKNKEYNGIIVNSGNANAFCGSRGLEDAREMAKTACDSLSVRQGSVLCASTGIIARYLPIHKIKYALPKLAKGLSALGIDKAKRAIMTTDKFEKEISATFNISGRRVSLCGIAKGSGMIAPDMATMLAFIFTDANITYRALNSALGTAVKNSFNCITVDGCMSTNDAVFVLANRLARNVLIDDTDSFNIFTGVLNFVCLELAKMIVKDAEGATKFITIKVAGARNYSGAKKIGLAVANSNLFKTAMFASSANCFGRIAAAAGASGVDFAEKDLKIKFSALNKKDVDINISVGRGTGNAVVYTSDLSYEYVKINAEYN